ncbi:MAG TPA: tRNA pseudouridine(38-40) synthase TruA [Desulfobacteraceae bacterium]|nr:tRNA pseudouridine(38-40) synthase TruA [Desulfobacteraceae bacterium]
MGDKNIKLILSYDGSHYHGWQRQKNCITVQEVIEEKIQIMFKEPLKLFASGRTDAGVHAINQVCNFKASSNIGPETTKKGLNSLLPEDIFVKDTAYVPLDFHARYSAKSKIYEYRILNRKDPDIFRRNYLWHIPAPLNSKEMEKCLSLLVGRHNFASFRSSGSGNIDPVRSVTRAELHYSENGLFRLVIEANGFLRHMVRNIAGTLVGVGRGKIDFEKFKEIFASRDRCQAGVKAPPQGLFLMKVHY